MSTCAGVVTYNPDISRLLINLNSLFGQVKFIILVDNGSSNHSIILDTIKHIEQNNIELLVISNKENQGIAFALNQIIEVANDRSFEWVITLDQDTVCERNLVQKYAYALEVHDKENVGIIGPSVHEVEEENLYYDASVHTLKKTRFLITSGALTNVKAVLKVGGFARGFFIDAVDWELCLKFKKNGYEILKLEHTFIDHRLGEKKFKKILWFQVQTISHSPVRYYYLNRNCISMIKNYMSIFPNDVFWIINRVINKNIKLLLFEDNKITKILMVFKGLWHGLYGKMGVHN